MKPTILILDDQSQYLRALERSLRSGFDVVLATSRAEATARLSDDLALALTDIRLDESREDDRQGLDFIREVRGRFPHLPIVAMSALDSPDIENAALAAGATRFLRKPIVVTDLKALLSQLLGSTK